MYIYKIINTINGKWYIGKHNGKDPNYIGSGKLLTQAIKKYGKDSFKKEILENCFTEEELNLKEKHWVLLSNAINDPMSYNLAKGGEGGDLSKFIDYKKRTPVLNPFKKAKEWIQSLTEEQKKEFYSKQATTRSKGWYVSRIDDPNETYVKNISKWCEENGVDKSMPTALNNPSSRLYLKQTKGWRIRRSDMPLLLPYENLRGKVIVDNGCKGKGWKIVKGKRVWYDK